MTSFAMPQGVTVEEMARAMSVPMAAEPEPKPRKRARDAAGRLMADDPATPENEAWQES